MWFSDWGEPFSSQGKVTQAGSIGGFNDQGGCGCGRPAVHLSPFTPWAGGMPRFARWGAVWVARAPLGPELSERLPRPALLAVSTTKGGEAVRTPLSVCSPWYPGPVECRKSRIGGLWGLHETRLVWVNGHCSPTPPKWSITGPGGGAEVTGVGTRLFGESPGVLRRLRGSSLE